MMSTSFEVGFCSVAALLNAERTFPAKTPKRWELISEYVLKSNNGADPYMVLGSGKKCLVFDSSAEHCKQLFIIISSQHDNMASFLKDQESIMFSDPSLHSSFKPIIILPRILNCCGHPIVIK